MKILLIQSQKVLIGNNNVDHSEGTIEFNGRATLNSYLNNYFPTGKLVNIPLAMHGELQFNGKSIWRRHKKYVKGDLVSIAIEEGSLAAVYDSCGNKIYPLSESRFYHVHVIDWIDNKDCSSPQLRQKHLRFRNKSSLTQFVRRNIRNCTVTNFPLGKRGAMHFLGNRFWDTLAGCKEHDLVTIEIKEKCVTCILDAAGKKLYPFNNGLYQLYVNGERCNIRFRDKTDLGKYILKNAPDCIVRNVPLPQSTCMQFLGKMFWHKTSRYKQGDLFSIVVKNSMPVEVNDCNNIKVYPCNNDNAYRVFQGGKFENGIWKEPGKLINSSIGNKGILSKFILRNRMDCVVENFSLGTKGKFQFLGKCLWDSKKGYKINDKVTIIIKDMKVREVYNCRSERIYPEVFTDRYVIITDGNFKDGKWVEPGKMLPMPFSNTLSLTNYVKKNIENCVIEKFPLSADGSMRFMGNVYWQNRKEYRSFNFVRVVIEDCKVAAIYDYDDHRLFPERSPIRMTIGGVFRNGRWELPGKEITLRYHSKGYMVKYIKKYKLSCILENVPLGHKGKLQFMSIIIWYSKKGCNAGDKVTIVIRDAKVKAVYDSQTGSALFLTNYAGNSN